MCFFLLYLQRPKCLKSYGPRAMANEKTDEIIASTAILLNTESQMTFAPPVRNPRAFSCQVSANEDVIIYTTNILRQFISPKLVGAALIKRNYNRNNPQQH